ncbi:hypothetical protein BN59_02031 [Legionella massiliensis]|uniref:Uncharacterized protein n=1 Tax=Legionella massiliensis TaxID=1034943 RepID=A0A078KXN9_9GAMM|nr:hypothetical protein [Legionella massiliensis]CDZ77741.1 hypothetical protein BN59_02031 [Legionella massiliensis]CEE13479.1 hypothetical protein BN1094_02031 [Legionella massiliensis]
MNTDEYIKLQEINKHFYDNARSQAEKNAYLAKMMEDEMKFMLENLPPIKAVEPESGKQLNFNLNKNNATPSQDRQVAFVSCEKLTPANLAKNVTATDSSGKGFDINKLPENVKQQICDALNEAMKAQLTKQFGKDPSMQMFDDGKTFGVKRNPQSIKNPDAEVGNIVTRAKNFGAQTSKQQDVKPSQQPGLSQENDNSTGMRI